MFTGAGPWTVHSVSARKPASRATNGSAFLTPPDRLPSRFVTHRFSYRSKAEEHHEGHEEREGFRGRIF